jgi:hypothetical protein
MSALSNAERQRLFRARRKGRRDAAEAAAARLVPVEVSRLEAPPPETRPSERQQQQAVLPEGYWTVVDNRVVRRRLVARVA